MTKAKPLSADNSPNAIDPELATRLSELDRTTPIPFPEISPEHQVILDSIEEAQKEIYKDTGIIDVMMLASDGTTQTFDDVGLEPSLEAELERTVGAFTTTDEETHATNPYLLESSTVLGDLRYEGQRAQLLINQIEHEIEHLTQDADFQIQRIVIRRDAELAQRTRRKADLMKIVEAAALINGKDQANGE